LVNWFIIQKCYPIELTPHECPYVHIHVSLSQQIQAFLCDWGDQEWRTNNKLTIENGKPTMEDLIVNDKQTLKLLHF
jgi:hypothetical protein